jgi:hypothetical protein
MFPVIFLAKLTHMAAGVNHFLQLLMDRFLLHPLPDKT